MRRTTEKTFKGALPVDCLSYGFPISSSKCGGLSVVVHHMVFLLFEQSIEMMNCVLFELSIGSMYCISNDATFVTTNLYKPCIGISRSLMCKISSFVGQI